VLGLGWQRCSLHIYVIARESETESLLALVDLSAAFETFAIFAGLQKVMAFRSGASHASGGGGSRHSPPSSSEARAFIPRLPCAYFQAGTCSKGDRCSFSHDPSMPYKKSHCKHYAAGHCMPIALSSFCGNSKRVTSSSGTKGNACTFIHDPSRAPPPNPVVKFKLNATSCSDADLVDWWINPAFGPPPSHPLARSNFVVWYCNGFVSF
jgi:hypothetical protein